VVHPLAAGILAMAIWVYVDARAQRVKDSPGWWAIGTFFLGFVVLPCYVATRKRRPA
jgi:hypothetical protein